MIDCHHNYIAARNDLVRALQMRSQGGLIFVIGPSGVGKSTLKNEAFRIIWGQANRWGCGHLPVVQVHALLPSKAYFSSAGLASSLVQELLEPRLDWLTPANELDTEATILIREQVRRARSELAFISKLTNRERDLWEQLTELTDARRSELLSIEQAASLCVNHRNKSPADYILHLMSIAEMAKLTFVFTGVPKMAELWMTRREVGRRADKIFVRPYSVENGDEMAHYIRVLRTLVERLPIDDSVVEQSIPLIASATAGIYGEAVKFFSRAKLNSERNGHERITKADLEEAVSTQPELDQLWSDVRAFAEICRPANTSSYEKLIAAPKLANTS